MSLLLDALKKAAEDKKKASNNTDSINSTINSKETVNNKEVHDSDENNKSEGVSQENEHDVTEGLTLDIETEQTVSKADNLSDKSTSHNTNQLNINRSETNGIDARDTVSDEALSLLIYKTNTEEKKRKRTFAMGATVASLLVVGLSGLYYYLNLQEGIENLEIKHRTAMMRMESKTNKQRTPEKTEIIDNLTANSEIKIEKKVVAAEVKEIKKITLPEKKVVYKPRNEEVNNKQRLLLIEKNKKVDLVGKKLEAAFEKYESGKYTEAENIYAEVLVLEKNNRDALLGLGAIAVVEKDAVAAKKYYKALLKLDPSDPIAVAALTNLRSNNVSPQDSEKYLVAMLEKTPDAAQLNFELGNVYAQQDNWSAAQASYFKAWQKESDNPDYIFNLAVSMDQLGKQKQAVNFYKDSLLKAKNKQVSFSREVVEQRVTELSGL